MARTRAANRKAPGARKPKIKLPPDSPPVIYLRWRDACFSSDTTSVSEAVGLVELHEVGWLLGQNDEAVTIGMEWEPGMAYTRFYLTIPKVNIDELVVLRPGQAI